MDRGDGERVFGDMVNTFCWHWKPLREAHIAVEEGVHRVATP